jgi:hypothetical protein
MEASGQLHVPATLPLWESPRYHWKGSGEDTVEKCVLSLPRIEPLFLIGYQNVYKILKNNTWEICFDDVIVTNLTVLYVQEQDFKNGCFHSTPHANPWANYVAVPVWNLVSHIKGRIKTEGVWEQGVECNIRTKEAGSNMRLEKTA